MNLVTYLGAREFEGAAKYDPDLVFATKQFRKLNQNTPCQNIGIKFWLVEDARLAAALGIKTAGDVYLVQREPEGHPRENGASIPQSGAQIHSLNHNGYAL